MMSRIFRRWRCCLWSLLLCVLLAPGAGGAGTVGGATGDAETLRLGEAMYRKGMLPSGRPMRAFVQGDIGLSGGMTACAGCHRRSGLGSLEGGVLTPPHKRRQALFASPGHRRHPRPVHEEHDVQESSSAGLQRRLPG